MWAAEALVSPVLGCVVLGCVVLGGAHAEPPNISVATVPVAYYGSSYITKSPAVYEMLSKQRVVILMQQDGDKPAGHCWLECCPERNWDPIGRCQGGGGTSRSVPLNASLNPGCNPSCDQHGKQVREFGIIKQTARAAGAVGYYSLQYSELARRPRAGRERPGPSPCGSVGGDNEGGENFTR